MLYISKTKNLSLEFFLYLTSIQRYQLPIFFYHAFRGHLYTGVPELPLQRKKGVCTVASKKFWSSMSFQNLVRLSQIKKFPCLIMPTSTKCQKIN
jgi:hypothetical protein